MPGITGTDIGQALTRGLVEVWREQQQGGLGEHWKGWGCSSDTAWQWMLRVVMGSEACWGWVGNKHGGRTFSYVFLATFLFYIILPKVIWIAVRVSQGKKRGKSVHWERMGCRGKWIEWQWERSMEDLWLRKRITALLKKGGIEGGNGWRVLLQRIQM